MAEPTESDALAETAAAEGSDTGSRPLGATATAGRGAVAIAVSPTEIGRYRIDGVLGQGAMGVVYAARDPDLDRRVALKVLRGGGTDAARARLLREARAMARLAHPAVVTVHEVGTAGGVDYVAMELIDGTTVAEWIRAEKPGGDDIVAVLEVAGRGLAAAHAAGLVHRDFKPHNVLRSRRGRVVVTDFGLARESLHEPEPAGEGQERRDGAIDAGSLSSTLTATGAVLGTPAYMAPEQHDGAAVGPAADQFAYCVTMWEALVGARPFPGLTLGEVRRQIDRGPEPAGEAGIPRRLRAPLRRGLSADPDARFPSMDALLAAIRPRSRRVWALAGVGALAVAAVVVVAVGRGHAPAVAALPGCGPADRELAAFRASPARARLAATPHGAELVKHLDAYAVEWQQIQPKACGHPSDPLRTRRASCMNGIRADLERTLAGAAAVPPDQLHSPEDLVGDPGACASAQPPNRVILDDAAAVALTTLVIQTRNKPAPIPDPGQAAPCLQVMALMAQLERFDLVPAQELHADLAAAAGAADRCGDDRLAAGVTILSVSSDPSLLSRDPGAMRRIEAAVQRSGNDRFLAALGELCDGVSHAINRDLDGAIDRITHVVDTTAAFGVRAFSAAAAQTAASWRMDRGGPGDAARAEALLRGALADVGPTSRGEIVEMLFSVLEAEGKSDEANQLAAEHRDDLDAEPAPPGSIAITGRVLDEAGRPVAGARVVAQPNVSLYADALDPLAPSDHTAATGQDGTFAIASVAPDSIVMAAIDSRRAMPVERGPRVELRLHPTGSVFGRFERVGERLGRVAMALELQPSPLDRVDFIAPIGSDGSFRLDHVPQGKARVIVGFGAGQREHRHQDITIGPTPVGPVVIEVAQHGAPLHVVVRNQADIALTFASVWVIRGQFSGKVAADIPTERTTRAQAYPGRVEDAAAPARTSMRTGDIAVVVPAVEPGEVTVCGFGLSGNLMETDFRTRFEHHANELEIGCVAATIKAADQVVVVEVPPMKRLPP